MTAETSNARGEWVLVPREPTAEMVQASDEISCRAEGAEHWTAMLAAAPQPPSAPVGVEWDMPCGECSCGIYDARAFAAFDGTFPKCKRFDRYCVGAIHCAQAFAQQPAAVDEAMVDRAGQALYGTDWGSFEGWEADQLRRKVRAVLTAALAAQHQEPTT